MTRGVVVPYAPDWGVRLEDQRFDVGALYREMAPRLRRQLGFQGATPEQVDDVLQEIFELMLLGHVKGPAKIDSMFAYLAAVANKRLYSLWRRNREVPAGGPHELHLEEEASGDSADVVVDQVVISTMISELPENVRDAALLRADGYEKHVIASFLGVSVSVVGLLLPRFRQAIREATSPGTASLGSPSTAWLSDPERDWGAPLPALRPAGAPRSGWDRINLAIAQLPPRQREVVARYVYGQLKPREVASQLQISANSTRVSLHHAYVTLGNMLGLTRRQIQEIAGRKPHPRYAEPAA